MIKSVKGRKNTDILMSAFFFLKNPLRLPILCKYNNPPRVGLTSTKKEEI